ncbi:MAG TPA: NAD(P)-dependent oxidoreductase [Zeimonas sp.]|nr:NAD(P)-dependent oxidoreductase [Zeimonas sp.]
MGEANERVGMIGVGLMGHGIARNLLRHGHELHFLEHPGNQPVDDLLAAGARTCSSAAELAAGCPVLILCVTGTLQVEDVLLREGGVLDGLREGGIVVDCSTAIPSSTLRIAAAIAARGGRFLDAPMTRTPREAAEGRLNLLVGGDADLFERCRPLLACFAENILHAGPVGAGHRLKLLHNYVSLGFGLVLAEAAACARRAGVDDRVFLEVLAQGGGQGVVLERLRPYLESGDVGSFRFTIANAAKDMGYYATMAQETGAACGAAAAVRDAYARAAAAGCGSSTVPQMIELLARGT